MTVPVEALSVHCLPQILSEESSFVSPVTLLKADGIFTEKHVEFVCHCSWSLIPCYCVVVIVIVVLSGCYRWGQNDC